MDLSFLDKFLFDEDTTVNIVANIILKKVVTKINVVSLRYINYFNPDKNNYSEKMLTYFYLIGVIYDTNCILLDTKELLDGKVLENEYNNLVSEDSIILLYMKLKFFCFKNILKILSYEPNFSSLIISQIQKYENFFNQQNTELLDKDIDIEKKETLLINELKKTKIMKISTNIIFSYYLYRFEQDGEQIFETFINKVEDLTGDYIDKNLNTNIENFSEYLISNI